MPADRPQHRPIGSFPFDEPRRSSSSSVATTSSFSSSSSSPATRHPSTAPSPSSTLDSDYPPTPPSFQPLSGSHHHPFLRTQTTSFPPPPHPSSSQHYHHHQHQQGGPSRLGSGGLGRSRDVSVGYDPGGVAGGPSGVSSFAGFSSGAGGGPTYSHSPAFTQQELVIYGPSVEYGFKGTAPLSLPFESRTPAPALLQPYFHSPVSPAPPFYPNYEGPPVFENPSLPSQEEMQVWEEESEGGRPAPDRTLQMSPPVLYRSTATTDCKRCREYGVNCAWPGSEGVGACSNCFFSYSLCENSTPNPLGSSSDSSFGGSAARNQQDGERTPTQSPILRPTQRSASDPSSPFGLPSSAMSSSSSSSAGRSTPHIPISFLLTEPIPSTSSSPSPMASGPSATSSRPPSNLGRYSLSPPTLPSGSSAPATSSRPPSNLGRSSTTSPPNPGGPTTSRSHDLVEGEMTELFDRVVQLQASANSRLSQVVEKLKSPQLSSKDNKLPSISSPLSLEAKEKESSVTRTSSTGSAGSSSVERPVVGGETK